MLCPRYHSNLTLQVLLPALRSDMASLPLPSDRLQPAATWQPSSQDTVSQLPPSSQQTNFGVNPQLAAGNKTSSTAASETGQNSQTGSQAGSKHSSAASITSTMQGAASVSTAGSEALSEAAASVADDIPIQPRNCQTAVGARISPNIGRRSTPFSSSEPADQPMPGSSQEHASTEAHQAGNADDTMMQEAFHASIAMAESQPGASSHADQQAFPMLGPQQPLSDRQDPPLAMQSTLAGLQAMPMDARPQPSPMQVAAPRQGRSTAGAYLECNPRQERPGGEGWRCYLTCCVRLSVEKEPHR